MVYEPIGTYSKQESVSPTCTCKASIILLRDNSRSRDIHACTWKTEARRHREEICTQKRRICSYYTPASAAAQFTIVPPTACRRRLSTVARSLPKPSFWYIPKIKANLPSATQSVSARVIVLSWGIRISTVRCLVLSRVWQTGRQTNRQNYYS